MIDNIEVNIQNSIRITSRVGVIYVDPLEIPDERHDADYILITHDHYDHFSAEDIRKVAKSDGILVVPEKMSGKAQEVADVVSGRTMGNKLAGMAAVIKVMKQSMENHTAAFLCLIPTVMPGVTFH